MKRCPGARWSTRVEHGSVPDSSAGVVAVVHPRLSDAAARALEAAGFTRLADTGRFEVWVRHPSLRPASSHHQIPDQKEST